MPHNHNLGLGGFQGFYVKKGLTTITTSGCYIVPPNFNSILATVNPGTPGSPGGQGGPVPCGKGNRPGCPGSPGSPGNPSTFKGAGTTTYTRKSSALVPRQVISVVVGTGGAGGAGGNPGGASGNPGCPGSVTVCVS